MRWCTASVTSKSDEYREGSYLSNKVVQLPNTSCRISEFVLDCSETLLELVVLPGIGIGGRDEGQFVHLLHEVIDIRLVLCNRFRDLPHDTEG